MTTRILPHKPQERQTEFTRWLESKIGPRRPQDHKPQFVCKATDEEMEARGYVLTKTVGGEVWQRAETPVTAIDFFNIEDEPAPSDNGGGPWLGEAEYQAIMDEVELAGNFRCPFCGASNGECSH